MEAYEAIALVRLKYKKYDPGDKAENVCERTGNIGREAKCCSPMDLSSQLVGPMPQLEFQAQLGYRNFRNSPILPSTSHHISYRIPFESPS